MMGTRRWLPGEEEQFRLRPHVLSWLGQYLIGAVPLIVGLLLAWIYRADWWNTSDQPWYKFWTYLYGNQGAGYAFAILMLAIPGLIAAMSQIKWRLFGAYLFAGIVAIVLDVIWKSADYDVAVPLVLAGFGIIGVFVAELARRKHLYIVTNVRLLFSGGYLIKRERQLRYESITDLDISQGPLGRMFDYGTLIPITQSGFGLGTDEATIAAGVGVGADAGKAKVGIGIGGSGTRGVQTGRARSYAQLTGIRPLRDVQYVLEGFIHQASGTPYLREQVDLTKQLLDTVQNQGPLIPPQANFGAPEPSRHPRPGDPIHWER